MISNTHSGGDHPWSVTVGARALHATRKPGPTYSRAFSSPPFEHRAARGLHLPTTGAVPTHSAPMIRQSHSGNRASRGGGLQLIGGGKFVPHAKVNTFRKTQVHGR